MFSAQGPILQAHAASAKNRQSCQVNLGSLKLDYEIMSRPIT
jgi:hypothetical protein